MGPPWYFYILVIMANSALGLDITPGPDVLNYTKGIVYMMENNHNFSDYKLLLYFSDKPAVRFLKERFEYSVDAVENTSQYAFKALESFDYENNQKSYILTLDGSTIINIAVLNYDDEPPTLTSPFCSMKENTNYTKENTNCTSILSDPDGWLDQTTFTIIDSDPNATTDLERETKLFSFEIDETLNDTVYSTPVYITTKMELDYETKIFYSFKVQAMDGAGHPTTPNENVQCIIDVIDQNDQPPQFTDYFTTQQILEKHEYNNFSVTAVDGDKGINAAIYYYIIPIDSEDDTDPYITIDKETGDLLIKGIDRDAKDLTTYKFQIMAQEQDDPPFTTNKTVTLFLEDIDDNCPLVMSLTYSNGSDIDYTNVDVKVAQFSFLENFAGTIDGTIKITDIDMGNNALFNVELKEDEKSTIAYTDAFFIVPTAGYRSADFQISVKNATYLDFENPPWDHFQFYVHSFGKLNSSMEDELLIEISLIDYNDEVPIFENSSYECSVNETIKKNEFIIQVKATDRDAEDAELTHAFVSTNAITKTMNIETIEGIITVAVDDAFDYDRINPLIFQVKAIDHADPPHVTTVPVTINLLDVNNKAPTYIVDGVIRVDENQDIGTYLNTSITASDVDTTRNLTAKIDWDSSYVMKNSLRLNNSLVHDQMQFLDLEFNIVNGSTDGTIEIKLRVNDVNPSATAPDYETFDTLYLSIIITDLNTELPEFADEMNTVASIVININDINDNPPIFTNATLLKNRTVYEDSSAGIIVGTIEAVDADVGDIVTYNCTYVDEEYDWFESDLSGQIQVKKGSIIDCDTDQILYVEINCSATDGLHITWQNFSIYILDKNNKYPQINVNRSSADLVEVYEKSPAGQEVTEIAYTDADRDIPYKTSRCVLEASNKDCYDAFETQNNIVVVKEGAYLDRDDGLKSYTCKVTCTDNPNNVEDEGHNSNSTTFVIKLLDINDHTPALITFEITTNENVKKGDSIDVVQGEDKDEFENADIDFKILNITKNDQEFTENIFDITKCDDYNVSDIIKQWHLTAKEDLRDFYGTYILQLELSDKGKPPRSTEDNATLSEKSKLTVDIKKYNYYEPEFTVPNEGDQFYLSPDQQVRKQLVLSEDNLLLDNFKIMNVENNCSDKWDPTYDVKQLSPVTPLFFTIVKLERCKAQLQVQNYDKAQALSIINFKLKVSTTLDDVSSLLPGEKAYNSSVDIEMSFVNINEEPYFDDVNNSCVLYFLEEQTDNENTTGLLDRKAHYSKLDVKWPIYYFLISEDPTVQSTFAVDKNSGNITQLQKLDYEEIKSYTFQVLASRNDTQTSDNKNSYLDVIVNVLDINDHTPEWTQIGFFGALMKNTAKDAKILTIEATDEDEIDQGKLEYSINSTVERHGSDSIKKPDVPFILDSNSGEVTLNFIIDYTMYGYFVFRVSVQDQQDAYGFGPNYNNSASVTIYIVTDDNSANFRFENSLVDVTNTKQNILAAISAVLGWGCYDQNIQPDSENGQESTSVTVASIYCVSNNNTLLTSDDILKKLANINTFQNLKKELLKFGILLQSFKGTATPTDNLEQILKIALIVVSSILGALVIILGVTLFLKVRGLTTRLKKLTEQKFGSDESSLNRKAINAPTTNVFAIEGSNPVFNNDITNKDLRIPDNDSDDSDLIGVEDNPEFDTVENSERF